MIGGIKIFTSTHVPLTERKNIARSPSRALRRWRKGIRKVTPFADVPVLQAFQMPGGAMVMHPAVLDRLRREIDALSELAERVHTSRIFVVAPEKDTAP